VIILKKSTRVLLLLIMNLLNRLKLKVYLLSNHVVLALPVSTLYRDCIFVIKSTNNCFYLYS